MYEVLSTDEFENWYKDLKDGKVRVRITDNLNRMKDGNFGITRFVGDGVYEKKINLGAGYRVYYFIKKGHLIIVLCGGTKRTQKSDIEKAKHIRKELNDSYVA